MNTYDSKAKEVIKNTLQEFSQDTLCSNSRGAKIMDCKQVLAIGISKANLRRFNAAAQLGTK